MSEPVVRDGGLSMDAEETRHFTVRYRDGAARSSFSDAAALTFQ